MLAEVAVALALTVPSSLLTPAPKSVTLVESPRIYSSVTPRGAERWRDEVRAELKKQGVYSKRIENTIVTIIHKESRGNPDARNGQHLGLLQFNSGWGSANKRLNPEWSIARIVRVYRKAGMAGLERHWLRWER